MITKVRKAGRKNDRCLETTIPQSVIRALGWECGDEIIWISTTDSRGKRILRVEKFEGPEVNFDL